MKTLRECHERADNGIWLILSASFGMQKKLTVKDTISQSPHVKKKPAIEALMTTTQSLEAHMALQLDHDEGGRLSLSTEELRVPDIMSDEADGAPRWCSDFLANLLSQMVSRAILRGRRRVIVRALRQRH